MTEERPDNKAHIRGQLDLDGAQWTRAEPEGEHIPDALEYAHVAGPDGKTYTALRRADQPDGLTLVFDAEEWKAWVEGRDDGEFELPEEFFR